jgi:hypothetical protein
MAEPKRDTSLERDIAEIYDSSVAARQWDASPSCGAWIWFKGAFRRSAKPKPSVLPSIP